MDHDGSGTFIVQLGTVVSVSKCNQTANNRVPWAASKQENAVWFDFKSDEGRIVCPACHSVGNGLLSREGETASYFCLTCLTRTEPATALAREPGLVERLARLAGRKG